MNICILNASNPKNIHLESDEYVDLRDRSSCFKDGKIIKQCRSWHSWAYALETEFFVYNKQGWPGIWKYDGIIVLVNRDIHLVFPLIKQLKDAGKKVAISYHEGLQDLLHEPNKLPALYQAVQFADFYVNIFGQYQSFFSGWFKEKSKFVNHTSPFDWKPDFVIPFKEKSKGILCGTRTFNQRLSRNTFVTLATLQEDGVELITEDGPAAEVQAFLKSAGLDIVVHQGPLEYNEWLRFLNQYKYVANHDMSMNLSQIVFDCLMVKTIPFGGSNWLDIFLDTEDSGDSRNLLYMGSDENNIYSGRIGRLMEFFHPDKVAKDLRRLFE